VSANRRDSEAEAPVNVLHEPGPVEFLARRVARQLVAMRYLHRALGAVLDAAEEAAVEDLPRIYIPLTATDEHLEKSVRLAGEMHCAAKEARDSLAGAHLEADLAFRAEMGLDREERRKGAMG
jgi:hypothetical protein